MFLQEADSRQYRQMSVAQKVDRMTQISARDLKTISEILPSLYATTELDVFPHKTLRMLARIVPADIRGYNEINLHKQRLVVINDPPEALSSGDEQIASQYLHEQPIVTAYKRTHDGRAYKISDFLTQRQFHSLTLYNEFYRRRMTEDLMAITFATPALMTIAISFSRSRRSFTERDRMVLNALRPHLVQAYHNAVAFTRVQKEAAKLKQVLGEGNRGVIFLTSEGHVKLMTEQAWRWVHDYFENSSLPIARVPEALWEWICQQRTTLAREDDFPAPRIPLQVEGKGKQLIVRLLTDQEGQLILLLEERRTLVSSALLAPLGLTKREGEILYWVTQGKTNKEIAQVLDLSPHTIRSRLEDLYGKLGVSMRAAAARWFIEGRQAVGVL